MDVAKSHVAKSNPPEQVDHVLHQAHPLDPHHNQPPPQRGGEERNERRVVRWFPLNISPTVSESEFLQVLENPNEVYDLSIGPSGCSQAEGLERW